MTHFDREQWCHNALSSVFSLWNPAKGGAWRSSHEIGRDVYRPTVTFNSIVTFDEYGLFSSPLLKNSPKAPFHFPSAHTQLSQLLTSSKWLNVQLTATAHGKGSRRIILLSNLLSAIRVLVTHSPPLTKTRRGWLRNGIDDATLLVLNSLEVQKSRSASVLAEYLADNPSLSSSLLLYVRLFLVDRAAIFHVLELKQSTSLGSRLTDALHRYFEKEVDRLMARRGIGDSGFDSTSLAFAMKGRMTYEGEAFRESAFFASCIQAIANGQGVEGTWPDGVTALAEEGAGDTLQQPSIQTALTLAQLVFEPRMLVRFHRHEMTVLRDTLEPLHKTARYLATTHVRLEKSSGWVSDRVRWPNTAETWITALAARYLLTYLLACRAVHRAAILERFSTTWPTANDLQSRVDTWAQLVEPDSTLTPQAVVTRTVVDPILKQQRNRSTIATPDPNGTSLIIYGPPGSGKTFFVGSLSSVIGWPLVELSPGNFISDGAELIETKAKEIFDLLMQLDHAIVFFDECDELFFDRDVQKHNAARNILSFVTACMLPKLQNLHDRRNVVFIVATNYLSRIDRAIRRPGRFDHILLLDRPDANAREALLRNGWARANLTATNAQMSKQISQTAGLTTKEIIDYTKNFKPSDEPPLGSKSDYIDWCTSDGVRELFASRDPDSKRLEVVGRWNQILPNPVIIPST